MTEAKIVEERFPSEPLSWEKFPKRDEVNANSAQAHCHQWQKKSADKPHVISCVGAMRGAFLRLIHFVFVSALRCDVGDAESSQPLCKWGNLQCVSGSVLSEGWQCLVQGPLERTDPCQIKAAFPGASGAGAATGFPHPWGRRPGPEAPLRNDLGSGHLWRVQDRELRKPRGVYTFCFLPGVWWQGTDVRIWLSVCIRMVSIGGSMSSPLKGIFLKGYVQWKASVGKLRGAINHNKADGKYSVLPSVTVFLRSPLGSFHGVCPPVTTLQQKLYRDTSTSNSTLGKTQPRQILPGFFSLFLSSFVSWI